MATAPSPSTVQIKPLAHDHVDQCHADQALHYTTCGRSKYKPFELFTGLIGLSVTVGGNLSLAAFKSHRRADAALPHGQTEKWDQMLNTTTTVRI